VRPHLCPTEAEQTLACFSTRPTFRETTPESVPVIPLTRPTVFVVDDDELVPVAIEGILKAVGLHAETFGSPK
jgi:hypothetical protein